MEKGEGGGPHRDGGGVERGARDHRGHRTVSSTHGSQEFLRVRVEKARPPWSRPPEGNRRRDQRADRRGAREQIFSISTVPTAQLWRGQHERSPRRLGAQPAWPRALPPRRIGLQRGHTGLQPGHTGLQPGHTGLQPAHTELQPWQTGLQPGYLGLQTLCRIVADPMRRPSGVPPKARRAEPRRRGWGWRAVALPRGLWLLPAAARQVSPNSTSNSLGVHARKGVTSYTTWLMQSQQPSREAWLAYGEAAPVPG